MESRDSVIGRNADREQSYDVGPPMEMKISVMEGALYLGGQLWLPKGISYSDLSSIPDKKKIIAYPGWLDNAGSFTNLAMLLVQYGFVVLCIDPPGTGHSDHLPMSSVYSDFNEAPLIPMIADDMGWERFIIISHSRGSGISALAAGAFPDRVIALVVFDSVFGVVGTWWRDIEEGKPTAPERMYLAYKQVKINRERKMRVFKTVEEAIDASENNEVFKKSRDTARNIVLRHLKPCKDGFTFTHDMRTYGTQSFVSTHEETLRSFLRNITCPVLSIVAEGGIIDQSNPVSSQHTKKVIAERLNCVKNLSIKTVKGAHHLHSDHPFRCMKILLPFLNEAAEKSTEKQMKKKSKSKL